MDNAPRQEPQLFVIGDTLFFERYFPDYLPSKGWSLSYTLTAEDGTKEITFTATVDGDHFKISEIAFGAGLTPGGYVLTGEVINVANNWKHQIYKAPLRLNPDLADGLAGGSIQTLAQQMLETIGCTLKEMYRSRFAETDVQRNRFSQKDQEKVLRDWKFWYAKRQEEIQLDRVRNGRPSGAISQPFFAIG